MDAAPCESSPIVLIEARFSRQFSFHLDSYTLFVVNSEFEWDPLKASANLVRHGVSFAEAATVFFDPLSITVTDPLHSGEENRFVITGLSYQRRALVVVHSDRGDRIRIISARLATRNERNKYEQGAE